MNGQNIDPNHLKTILQQLTDLVLKHYKSIFAHLQDIFVFIQSQPTEHQERLFSWAVRSFRLDNGNGQNYSLTPDKKRMQEISIGLRREIYVILHSLADCPLKSKERTDMMWVMIKKGAYTDEQRIALIFATITLEHIKSRQSTKCARGASAVH